MGFDRFQLGDIYRENKIQETYGVSFENFVSDFATQIAKIRGSGKEPTLPLIVRELAQEYKSRTSQKQ